MNKIRNPGWCVCVCVPELVCGGFLYFHRGVSGIEPSHQINSHLHIRFLLEGFDESFSRLPLEITILLEIPLEQACVTHFAMKKAYLLMPVSLFYQ